MRLSGQREFRQILENRLGFAQKFRGLLNVRLGMSPRSLRAFRADTARDIQPSGSDQKGEKRPSTFPFMVG